MKTLYCVLLGIGLLFPQRSTGQYISLSFPIDYSVLQRNNSGNTGVWVSGQLINGSGSGQFSSPLYQITKLDVKTGNTVTVVQNWTSFSFSQYGPFRFSVNLPAGWYRVDLQATINGTTQSATAKFGVGDVFYIAGQSNAQGASNSSIFNETAYDGVVSDQSYENCTMQMPRHPIMQPIQASYGIGTQGPNSWCYTVMGNRLIEYNAGTDVPVAFFNGASFGTNLQNWLASSDNQATYYWFADTRNVCSPNSYENYLYVGQPYRAFKNLLNFQGGIFGARGIIWHQGEGDNQQATSTSDYTNGFNTLAYKFRSEVDNTSLACWIAKATYDETWITNLDKNGNPHGIPTWPDVQTAQANLGNSTPNRTGVDSDNIANSQDVNSSDHRPDGVHFSGNQLQALGTAWASQVNSNLLSTTPTLAQTPPLISISYNGSQYTASVQNYWGRPYFWTNAITDAIRLNPGNPTGSTQVLSGGQPFRCYVQTSANTYVASQVVRVPSGSYRMATLAGEEDNSLLSFKLYPNPSVSETKASFVLTEPSFVRLELLNAQGQLIRTIAEGKHDTGTYAYPVNLSQLTPGVMLLRLKANDLFITKKLVINN